MLVNVPVIDNIADTHIAPSPIHGLGLFADVDILAGMTLCALDGQVMSRHEHAKLETLYDMPDDSKQHIFMEWNALPNDMLLVRPLRTKYSFINHSVEPNACLLEESMSVIAKRTIHEGEEITIDYTCEPLWREYLERPDKAFLAS